VDTTSVFDDSVQAISDQLCRRGAEWRLDTVWLLVDGTEDALPETEGIDWTTRTHIPVKLAHPDIDPMWWPRWYPLQLDRAEDVWVLQNSIAWALDERRPERLDLGSGRRVTGWMWMPEHQAHDTAKAWGQTSIQRHGQHTSLLRLHDPAVLWSLWQLLTEAQKTNLMGSALAIDTLDPLGALTSLRGLPAASEQEQSQGRLRLGTEQWQDVLLLNALHPLLLQCRRDDPHMNTDAYKTLFTLALQALRRAQALGFEDRESLVLFGRLALQRHSAFERHPMVAPLLADREPGLPLGGVLADLTEDDWAAIEQSAKATPAV
jgi:hypothetical protein